MKRARARHHIARPAGALPHLSLFSGKANGLFNSATHTALTHTGAALHSGIPGRPSAACLNGLSKQPAVLHASVKMTCLAQSVR